MGSRTRFVEEARGNSEMAYLTLMFISTQQFSRGYLQNLIWISVYLGTSPISRQKKNNMVAIA